MPNNPNNQEKQSRWLTVKQTNWLISEMQKEPTYIHSKSASTSGGRWKNNRYVQNDKYIIKLYQSPKNQAGHLTIEFKDIINDRLSKEKQETIKQLKEQLKQHEELIAEMKKICEPDNIHFKMIVKKYNEIQEAIKFNQY